jgi:hypothetical protein
VRVVTDEVLSELDAVALLQDLPTHGLVANTDLPTCPPVVLIMTGARKDSILVMPAKLALCLGLSHDGVAYRPVQTEVQRQK